jgi:hypothetical protein
MSTSISGHVKNGVVVPNAPLPEGAKVEIRLSEVSTDASATAKGGPILGVQLTPAELRRMPREQRQAFLAAAAQMAEHD